MRSNKLAARCGSLLALSLLVIAGPARAEKPTPLEAKMGLYIHMINAWSNSVPRSREDYYQVVNPKVGVTCKESNIRQLETAPNLYTDNTVKEVEKLRAQLKKGPKLDSDVAANQMLDAMAAIFAVDDRVTHYFSLSKYEGDDCKRGKEIEATLLANWPKFFAAEKELRAVVEKYSDEQDSVRLKEAEKKYGQGLHYYQWRLLIDAKALIRAVDIKLSDTPQDPAPVRAAGAALKKSYDEAYPVFVKVRVRDDVGDTSPWSEMLSHVRELYEAAERRAKTMDEDIQHKRVNKYSGSEIEKMIKMYNDMVDSANRIEYAKNVK